MEPANQSNSPAIPIAIIIGFALIALAIFFTNDRKDSVPAMNTTSEELATATKPGSPRPVDNTDYIFGNPNAPILLIEYSDYDCPFCKQYHETLSRIIEQYGANGRVAWVYRQFPIAQLHPNSPKLSESALCVGKLGGNKAFWDFSRKLYDSRNIDEFTNVTKIPDYVTETGVSLSDYQACIESGEMKKVVEDSIVDGLNAGAGKGTPYTVVTVGNRQEKIIGAESYDFLQTILSSLIGQLDGSVDPTATSTPAQQ
jgi:protein-disulfide isomerase